MKTNEYKQENEALRKLARVESIISIMEAKHLEEINKYQRYLKIDTSYVNKKDSKKKSSKCKRIKIKEASKLFSLSSATSQVNISREREVVHNLDSFINLRANTFLKQRIQLRTKHTNETTKETPNGIETNGTIIKKQQTAPKKEESKKRRMRKIKKK